MKRLMVAALVALLSGSCSRSGGTPEALKGSLPQSHPPSAAQTSTPTQEEAVPRVLDFTAPKLGGGQVIGSELAGRDVVIWFWAPW